MSSIAASSAPASRRSVDWRRFTLVGLATVVAAVLANLVVYAIGGVLIGYESEFLVLATPGGTILFTIVPAIIAALFYAVLLRVTADPVRVFTIVAVIVLVLSVIPDFVYIPAAPGSSLGQIAVLVVMHVVAAVVIVRMLTTLAYASVQ